MHGPVFSSPPHTILLSQRSLWRILVKAVITTSRAAAAEGTQVRAIHSKAATVRRRRLCRMVAAEEGTGTVSHRCSHLQEVRKAK